MQDLKVYIFFLETFSKTKNLYWIKLLLSINSKVVILSKLYLTHKYII
jgi:hypothetical protein